jgi:hypothetical protein
MAILITEETRVLVQGMSGRIGQFHTQEMIEAGTNVVAGVTPGKGGTTVLNRPQFNTVREAVEATGADASLLFVPPPMAADAMMEAAEAGIRTAVCVTDGLPAQDMMKVKRFLRRYPREKKMRLIGPNCAGIISPGKGFMGIMPPHIYTPGRVGIVGRSGHAGLRGGEPDVGAGDRRVLLHRDRRRPDQRLVLPRYPGALRERPRDRRRDDDRRDRRPAGGGGGGLCPRSHDQARRGLCRGPLRAQGAQDGACGGDHLGLRRKRAGEGGDPAGGRDHGRAEPVADGRDGGAHPQGHKEAA